MASTSEFHSAPLSAPPSEFHSAPLSAPTLAPCHRGILKIRQEKALRSSTASCHPTAAQGQCQHCHSLPVPMGVLLPVHGTRHPSHTIPHIQHVSSMHIHHTSSTSPSAHPACIWRATTIQWHWDMCQSAQGQPDAAVRGSVPKAV